MLNNEYTLFGLVCSPLLDEEKSGLLHKAASKCNWDNVCHAVAEHRIGPLLYWHLRENGIQYPDKVKRLLAASYVRQTAIARAQTIAIAEIVGYLSRANIDSVVLKGGALAHLVYPDPALRPMDDLDILVPPDKGEDARKVLCDIGFDAPSPKTRYEKLHHHLPLAQRVDEGILVAVEVHTKAFNLLLANGLSLPKLALPLTSYMLDGQLMHALSTSQMLWMQYHTQRALSSPLRYISIADILHLAEANVDTIDWIKLRHNHPDLGFAFAALQAFSPLSKKLCEHIGLDPDWPAVRMRQVGLDYQGWPLHRIGEKRDRAECWNLLRDTFLLPEWWAHFIYGIPPSENMIETHLFRHPATLLSQGLRRLYLGPAKLDSFFKNPI